MKRRKNTIRRTGLDYIFQQRMSAFRSKPHDSDVVTRTTPVVAIIAALLSQNATELRPVEYYFPDALALLWSAREFLQKQKFAVDREWRDFCESRVRQQSITLREAMRALGYKGRRGLIDAIKRVLPKQAREIQFQNAITIADSYKIFQQSELGKKTRTQKAREAKKALSSHSAD